VLTAKRVNVGGWSGCNGLGWNQKIKDASVILASVLLISHASCISSRPFVFYPQVGRAHGQHPNLHDRITAANTSKYCLPDACFNPHV